MPHIEDKDLLALKPAAVPRQPPQPDENIRPAFLGARQDKKDIRPRSPLELPVLDIRTYQPDLDKVLEIMFGRPIRVDEHTGVCDLLRKG